MKIFIDSADLDEIRKYMSWGICDGVTTNPTICLKCGIEGGTEGIKQRTLEIADLIYPRPVSVEVTSDIISEVVAQGKEYATWAENIAVKVTITDRYGESMLPAIYRLVTDGVQVNVTAMMTTSQAILAAKCMESAGATKERPNFISIFAGRIADEHGVEQAAKVLRQTREWLDLFDYSSEIIVGSIRRPENVNSYAALGAHILTIPPDVLAKSLSAARTRETVTQFLTDAEKALAACREMELAQVAK
ncbi:transaldolase [Candidatus Poribacteria bacterium]|nr:transaldolase [Candidatus Poribacteria bacterium]